MALSYDNMTRHCFNTGLPFDIQRKNIICRLADNLQQIIDLSHDLPGLLANTSEIGIKKSFQLLNPILANFYRIKISVETEPALR